MTPTHLDVFFSWLTCRLKFVMPDSIGIRVGFRLPENSSRSILSKNMSNNLFTDLKPTPTEHFKLFFYAAVLNLLHHVTNGFDSQEAVFAQFPFLAEITTTSSPKAALKALAHARRLSGGSTHCARGKRAPRSTSRCGRCEKRRASTTPR